jgi:peptidoglycan/LPS O-acetylase OafA/YrhL
MPCRHLGRLSFSIYLLHFPLLFTVGSLVFIRSAQTLPYVAATGLTLSVFLLLVFAAALPFERWIDRPAMALSRRIGTIFSAARHSESAPTLHTPTEIPRRH